jgi:ribosomal protein S18 acetylase RimI-like enzyme
LSGIIGLILNENNAVVGAAVVNNTNMEGYIPENILVYIALDKEYRKKGLGKKLLDLMIYESDGDIALHVDFDNKRARKVYKKMGFKEAYIEMRYKK